MILGHILRRTGDQLQFFRSVAHQPGVAAELDATFAELERAGHEAANLEQQLRKSTPGSPAFQGKDSRSGADLHKSPNFSDRTASIPTGDWPNHFHELKVCHSLPQRRC